jgi:hypothetical protein
LPYNLEVVNVVENNVLAIQRPKILPPASAEVVWGKRPKWLFFNPEPAPKTQLSKQIIN